MSSDNTVSLTLETRFFLNMNFNLFGSGSRYNLPKKVIVAPQGISENIDLSRVTSNLDVEKTRLSTHNKIYIGKAIIYVYKCMFIIV